MILEPIKMKEERELFFSSTDEVKELGCIGHLRGDFGKDGREFNTTWHEHKCHELNDDKFRIIFDAVINKLRENGNVLWQAYSTAFLYHSNKRRNGIRSLGVHSADRSHSLGSEYESPNKDNRTPSH